MKTFNFKSRDFQLNIAGSEFTVVCDDGFRERMSIFQSESIALADQVHEGKKTNKDAIELCVRIIDFALGQGAVEKIFNDRSVNLSDFSDIILFIADEVKSFTEKHQSNNLLNK